MVYTQRFEFVWGQLPRGMKKGKFQAQKTFQKLSDKGELPDNDVILKAIADQQKERRYLRSQNKFVPEWKHFSTWLNAGCWNDECFYQDEAPKPKPQVSNINNLHRAFNILCNVGEDKFKEFCEGVRMSSEDRERVWNKYNMSLDINKLAQRIGG